MAMKKDAPKAPPSQLSEVDLLKIQNAFLRSEKARAELAACEAIVADVCKRYEVQMGRDEIDGVGNIKRAG